METTTEIKTASQIIDEINTLSIHLSTLVKEDRDITYTYKNVDLETIKELSVEHSKTIHAPSESVPQYWIHLNPTKGVMIYVESRVYKSELTFK